jgi:hypothetical protein
MADSKRQQIIDKIDTRLKTILKTNGYLTDAGAHVYDWLMRPISPDVFPALVYRDPIENDEAATTGTIGYHRHQLTCEIEVLSSGSTALDNVRQILADIVTAIGTDTKWGGLAQSTNPGATRIDVDQESKAIAGALITFTITYLTKAWNPYS